MSALSMTGLLEGQRLASIDGFDDSGPISSVRPLPFSGMAEPISHTDPIVVVLVEARLLDDSRSPATADLEARLRRFHDDLIDDGFDARTAAVRLRTTAEHRDGEGVLAIRKLLKDVHETHPNLAGAILVGSFPEAMLVRRWIWRRHYDQVVIAGQTYQDVDLLYIAPEVIAERSDLVLSDLDGNWDDLYHQGPVALESIRAIPQSSMGQWPVDGGLFVSNNFERTTIQFEDFFWIRDDDFDEPFGPVAGSLVLRLWLKRRHPECTPDDMALANPIARPEIAVSRINARNVGVMPDPTFTDVNGRGFLDASGVPQAVKAASPLSNSPLGGIWRRDAACERRLLVDYFDRNHRFRRGDYYFAPFRAGAIASSAFDAPPHWTSAAGVAENLSTASPSFVAPVATQDADLLEFVDWLKQPVTLRAVVTHANAQLTEFDPPVDYKTGDLEAAVGGVPWRWKKTASGSTISYTPSLADQGYDADLHLYRSLWENKALVSAGPSFILHNGCHVNSPSGGRTHPYDDTAYAPFQEAEGMLFYLNGLAVISRAKEFGDFVTPHVSAGISAIPAARLADGLARYVTVDGDDANLGTFESTTWSKRTYWWSILGDWTLHLQYAPAPVLNFLPPLVAVWPLFHHMWLVTDGFEMIKVLPDEELAGAVAGAISRYGLTERYVIGDDDGGWEYYLANGEVPHEPPRGERRTERMAIQAGDLVVVEGRSGWDVRAGDTVVASTSNELDAHAVAAVLQRHEATAIHWVGDRAQPVMRFFTTGT